MKSFAAAFLSLLGVCGAASAGTLVGVHFGSNGAAPANWTLIASTASPVSNLIDESGAVTALSLAFASTGSIGFYDGTLQSATIPAYPNSLTALNGNVYDAGFTGGTLTVTLSGLTPFQQYEFYVFGIRFTDSTTLRQSISIQGDGASVDFLQSGSGNSLFINSSLGSSGSSLHDYAVLVTASGAGVISVSATGLSTDFGTTFAVSGLALSAVDTPTEVPEPSTLAGLLTGIGALGLLARQRLS